MELDSKREGGAGNNGVKLELMWLPTIGNDKRCRLIAGVIRDSLLILTEFHQALYRGNPSGSCFLFRKGRSRGYV
jgi:hypothetical protein